MARRSFPSPTHLSIPCRRVPCRVESAQCIPARYLNLSNVLTYSLQIYSRRGPMLPKSNASTTVALQMEPYYVLCRSTYHWYIHHTCKYLCISSNAFIARQSVRRTGSPVPPTAFEQARGGRSGSGWRQGRVRWGRPLLSRPRGAVGSGPAAVHAAVRCGC